MIKNQCKVANHQLQIKNRDYANEQRQLFRENSPKNGCLGQRRKAIFQLVILLLLPLMNAIVVHGFLLISSGLFLRFERVVAME